MCITDDNMQTKEKEKLKKYTQAALRKNLCFVPLVFNTYGNWTEKMDDLIKGLCNKIVSTKLSGKDNCLHNTQEHLLKNTTQLWRTRINVAIHRAIAWQLESRYVYLVNSGHCSRRALPHPTAGVEAVA